MVRSVLAYAAAASLVLAGCADALLLQVITLTRHGDRAPDVGITNACPGIFKAPTDVYRILHAYPGLLTARGIQRMRDAGVFIGQRYISGDHFDGKWLSNHGFMEPEYDTLQWEFMAREGNRQQMSMNAVALGIFPNTPIPTVVTRRESDNVLGGPAPECGNLTASMIINWHRTKGRELVDSQPTRDYVISEVEKICNVSLRGNPTVAITGGPNPHCWIGDISDTVDTWWASAAKGDPFTPDLQERLTDLAFRLEEGSHFNDPRATIWFAGGFPLRLIASFSQWKADPNAPQPRKSPKMRLHLCSRELFYGLTHIFPLEIKPPGQPEGRVVAGSTFIWELHLVEDVFHPLKMGLVVRSYYWQPGLDVVQPMMREVSLDEFRRMYYDYIKQNGGAWYDQCDLEHFDGINNVHSKEYINPEYAHIKAMHEKYVDRRMQIQEAKAAAAAAAKTAPPATKAVQSQAVKHILAEEYVNMEDQMEEEVSIENFVSVTPLTPAETANVANAASQTQQTTQAATSAGVSPFAAMIILGVLVSGAVYFKDSIKQSTYQSI